MYGTIFERETEIWICYWRYKKMPYVHILKRINTRQHSWSKIVSANLLNDSYVLYQFSSISNSIYYLVSESQKGKPSEIVLK